MITKITEGQSPEVVAAVKYAIDHLPAMRNLLFVADYLNTEEGENALKLVREFVQDYDRDHKEEAADSDLNQ